MAKKIFNYFLEYLAVQVIRFIFLAVPRGMALRIGRGLGSIAGFVLTGRQRLVEENLGKSFPELASRERDKIAKLFWRHIGQTLIEFIKLPHINRTNINSYAEIRGLDILSSELKNGKGVILVTAHIGNWEMMGATLSLKGIPLAAVARNIKNPMVNAVINRIRESSGSVVIPHRRAVKDTLKWLREGKALAILIDQNLYTGGVFVNFFNRMAATVPLVGLLAERTNCKVLGFRNKRESDKIIVEIMELGDINLQQHTQHITTVVENWIRETPEQWLWMHNRWKRQPEQV